MQRILFIIVIMAFAGCADDIATSGCKTPATVRNLTGFDGCGWVFELEDGQRLEPVRMLRCGTPPFPEGEPQDALADFGFVDGKKVFIDFEHSPSPSICMVGPTVIITCVQEVSLPTED